MWASLLAGVLFGLAWNEEYDNLLMLRAVGTPVNDPLAGGEHDI